jgi:hypothetical protein
LINNLKNTVSGQKLYDIVISLLTANDKAVIIQYKNPPPTGYEQYESVFGEMDDPNMFGIVMFKPDMGAFFEELTHAMQTMNSPHELNGVELKGNKELEAKIMRYDFAQENGIKLSNEAFYEILYNYANGNATFTDAVQAMGALGYSSSHFVFDESAFHTNNRTQLNN